MILQEFKSFRGRIGVTDKDEQDPHLQANSWLEEEKRGGHGDIKIVGFQLSIEPSQYEKKFAVLSILYKK